MLFAGLLHEGKSIRLALPFQDLTAALPLEDRNLEFQPKALAEAQYELFQAQGGAASASRLALFHLRLTDGPLH